MRGSIDPNAGVSRIVAGPWGSVGEIRNLSINGVLIVDGAGNITIEGRSLGYRYVEKPK